jgi:hypothetical protein
LNQNFFSGVPMSVRRVGWLAAMALATLLWVSCGQVYRPVVIPVSTTPPNPANFHAVFGISTNVLSNPGTALQIDVSGDSNIGVANMGVNPTHAVALPNQSRIFVASAGSVNSDGTVNVGGVDIITAFTPAGDSTVATGLGTPTIFTLPNVGADQSSAITAISEDSTGLVTVTLSAPLVKAQVGGVVVVSGVVVTGANPNAYDGSFTISAVSGTTIQYVDKVLALPSGTSGTATIPIPLSCSYQPDFLATTQASDVYVANYGFENDPNCSLSSTDSVAVLTPAQSTIANIAYLGPNTHPVALAETPDAQNLYVVNQGGNGVAGTIMDLSPTDLSTLATIALPSGSSTPVWAVARVDSRFVYVVTQGDGQLLTISTATNTVTSSQSVGGPGANFVLYDKSRNRLYVTNPTAAAVYVFDATSDAPTLLSAISMTTGANAPCPSGCSPVSVTAMPDGSRFYVASYQIEAACPDPNIGKSAQCIIPRLTVYDSRSMTVKPVSSSTSLLAPSISLLTQPQFAATQYAVAHAASCDPAPTYAPGTTRFRMSTAAAADSSHVYVSICDAGSIADIIATTSTLSTGGTNTPDQLVTDLAAPFSAAAAPPGGQTPPQNPIFLLSGQ